MIVQTLQKLKKKYFLFLASMLLSLIAFAQDEHSSAYNRGYLFGKGLAMLLVTCLVIWGIWRLTRKKKQ